MAISSNFCLFSWKFVFGDRLSILGATSPKRQQKLWYSEKLSQKRFKRKISPQFSKEAPTSYRQYRKFENRFQKVIDCIANLKTSFKRWSTVSQFWNPILKFAIRWITCWGRFINFRYCRSLFESDLQNCNTVDRFLKQFSKLRYCRLLFAPAAPPPIPESAGRFAKVIDSIAYLKSPSSDRTTVSQKTNDSTEWARVTAIITGKRHGQQHGKHSKISRAAAILPPPRQGGGAF